ncbi:hypothetical protein CMI48_04485 [Candidatus Pacearchaeota archaeon]|nr:hypothetical protein [Candidatus Pacearchaeota archaeon]|tara:strand:+ start:870 stop:1061 length:192 start_codon:yes stop_codon:yes gene_type:complete
MQNQRTVLEEIARRTGEQTVPYKEVFPGNEERYDEGQSRTTITPTTPDKENLVEEILKPYKGK